MAELYGPDLAFVHAEAFERLANAAAGTLLRNLRLHHAGCLVLDLGCGAGPLSRKVVQEGFKAWGVDASANFVAIARERLPGVRIECGSILDANLPRACAAAAVGEVLNYATADDPSQLGHIFKKVFDALEPNGVFLLDIAAPGRVGARVSFTDATNWAVGVVAAEELEYLTRDITIFRRLTEGNWTCSREQHRLQLWTVEQVTEQMARNGFSVNILTGYEGVAMPEALHVYCAVKPGE